MGCHLISYERGKEVAGPVRERAQGWEVIGARSLAEIVFYRPSRSRRTKSLQESAFLRHPNDSPEFRSPPTRSPPTRSPPRLAAERLHCSSKRHCGCERSQIAVVEFVKIGTCQNSFTTLRVPLLLSLSSPEHARSNLPRERARTRKRKEEKGTARKGTEAKWRV